MTTIELVKLNNLQLAGKLVSDELMLGIQHSRRTGVGTEFEQFRHYVPGDDPKRIDYKRLAQTGQYYVRESSTESNQHVRLLLDLSGSMNYQEAGVARLQYAKILLASLAYLANRQSDQISLYGLQNETVQPLVMAGRQSFQKIIATLETAKASGPWNNADTRFPEFSRKQSELLILVSDFLQVDAEWLNLIRSIAGPSQSRPGREIVIFQLLGDEEVEFNLSGFYRFQDMETGREMELQADSIRANVRQGMTDYLTMLDKELQLPHVRLFRARLSDPVALVLREFLL